MDKVREAAVEKAFAALIAREDGGGSWSTRRALFAALWKLHPVSHQSAQLILDSAVEATRNLRPGSERRVGDIVYAVRETPSPSSWLVGVKDVASGAEWSLDGADFMGTHHFRIFEKSGDVTAIISSGGISRRQSGRLAVTSVIHNPASMRALTRMAGKVAGSGTKDTTIYVLAPELASLIDADGGIPGEGVRKLHRMLFEHATKRAMGWTAPLFDRLVDMYAEGGFWWGTRAARWAFKSDGRFPEFSSTTTTSCLLRHPDRNAPAIIFRDAQPNLETETYVVWREMDGRMCLSELGEGSLDDIVEFVENGGVPALSFDPASGQVRATERAFSSNLLQSFCDHVGEAWSVMSDLPLYTGNAAWPMATDDFSVFGEIAPWTKRGRREAKSKVTASSAPEAGKASPAP